MSIFKIELRWDEASDLVVSADGAKASGSSIPASKPGSPRGYAPLQDFLVALVAFVSYVFHV
jgi:uncharacterized OsmC-like protein